MTALDDLTRKMFEIHEDSVKHIAGLQGLNSNVSTLSRAFTRIYRVSIDGVNAIIKAIMMLGRRMQGLFLTSFARDLMPTLPPILDAWNTVEEAVVSGLEPLKLSIFWRLTPPTEAIAGAIRGLAEGPGKMSILAYEGIAAMPSVPLVTPPPTQVMRTINDYVGRISEIEYKFFEAAPATALRVGIHYGGARRRATRGVFDAVRRGVKEAHGAKALATTPPQLEAVETIREISDRFVAPISVLAYPVAHARRYVADVSKVDRIAQPVTEEVSEAYGEVLETVSKVHEVSRFVGKAPVMPKPAIEVAETGRPVLTIPEIEKSLQLIAEGAAKAYITERVSEVPVSGAVRITQPITKGVSEAYVVRVLEPVSKVHEVSKSARRIPVPPDIHMRPAMEIAKAAGLILTIPDMKRSLQPITTGEAKPYEIRPPSIGPPPKEIAAERVAEAPVGVIVKYAPQIRSIGMLSRDTARLVADMRLIKPLGMEIRLVDTFLEARKKGLDRVSQEISEVYRAAASVPWTPSIREAANLVSDHIGKISVMALKGSELYGLGVSRIPLVTEAMEAALSVPSISELTKVPSLRIPVTEKAAESRLVLLVPEIEKFYQLVAEKIAETYRHGVISLLPPVEAVADRVTKASGLGISARALGRGFDLVEAGVKELPMLAPSVVHPPSTIEIARIGSSPFVAVSKISRTFDIFGVVLKEAVAKASPLGIVEAKQRYPSVEAMKAVESLSVAVPSVSEPFSRIMGEKYLEMARTPPIEPYLAGGRGLEILFELGREFNLVEGGVKEPSLSALSAVRSLPTAKVVSIASSPVVAIPETSQPLATGILSKMLRGYEMEMENIIKGYSEGIAVTLPRAPMGDHVLERVPLETPMSLPSVKLQEIIPLLSLAQTTTRRETPKATQRSRAVAHPRSITVNVEPSKGEIDLRELRRKIAQILREEARRHGVF